MLAPHWAQTQLGGVPRKRREARKTRMGRGGTGKAKVVGSLLLSCLVFPEVLRLRKSVKPLREDTATLLPNHRSGLQSLAKMENSRSVLRK